MLITFTGCVFCKYNTFRMDRGIAHFSFEYPSNYTVTKVEVIDDPKNCSTNIIFDAPDNLLLRLLGKSNLKRWEAPTSIFIFALPIDEDNYDVDTRMNEWLSLEKSSPEYKLVDRFQVAVAGVTGIEAICSYIVPDNILLPIKTAA